MSRRLALTFAAVALGVAGFVTADAVSAGRFAVHELMREGSPIAWLSSMLLAGASVAALVLALRSSRAPGAFFALAAALAAAAVDERFMGHERLKHFILATAFGYDRAAMGHWGDAPMALVPLVGAWLVWTLRRELHGRLCLGLLLGAIAAGTVAVALDIATLAPAAQAVEEVLEVVAETLFLMALLARVSMGRD
ncbi:MAG TPA: hypothetical protein VIG99_11040 [Myxococcaceae bacterium]|jgi:hypothetical protein